MTPWTVAPQAPLYMEFSLALPCMYKKTPLPNLEKELMVEVCHLLKNMEEGGLFSLSTFLLILKL